MSNGIIKPYPLVRIEDYIGEKCYVASEWRNEGRDAEPCLGDVRQLVKEYCILPLGSEHVRTSAPLIRSVLISGMYFWFTFLLNLGFAIGNRLHV